MSAAASSSLKPNGSCVTATTTLDGILLACSEDVTSLNDLIALPFDKLILTMQPKLLGSDEPPAPLPQSVHFTLLSHEVTSDFIRLTYERQPTI